MNQEGSQRQRPAARYPWDLDCVCLAVLLSVSFDADEQRALIEPYIEGEWQDRLDDEAWLLLTIHRACHRRNPVSMTVSERLDLRAATLIERIRVMDTASLSALVGSHSHCGRHAAELMWALLRDGDEERHQIGQHLVHYWLCRQARSESHAHAGRGLPPAALMVEQAFVSPRDLEKRVADQQATIDRMLEYIRNTRAVSEHEVACLLASRRQ
ncbi:MAG TPA: hypothetical protein PLO37_05325 [Candidatus Hydrogenedentes bacterium]|nr:hypothetical protein [Candidatus Hydrogenedentota bacterium]HPG66247.1 hypothetical protein [Candidatus Hydrogenedentota bacterium]